VFGERYPDPVRVVSIGVPIADLLREPLKREWMAHSIEFCGGTHLATTDEANRCVIITEQALAAGVRRIIALTGPAALAADEAGKQLLHRATTAGNLPDEQFLREHEELVRLAEEMTIPATTRHQLLVHLDALKQRAKSLRKSAESSARGQVVEQAHGIVEQSIAAGAAPIIVSVVHHADKDSLLAAMDVVRAKRPDAAAMLLSANMIESKVFIVASVPKDLIGRGLKAGDWVKKAASACGGSGGGKPDMAQAGGRDPTQIDKAIVEARAYAASVLKT
jgi:alanyl-tRNA synthetase